ncbi:MAG TPA: DMT family transporter [Acidimicrobiales bacterium]|nr:DMT family transporter [Acidimicrobiales bacterium]
MSRILTEAVPAALGATVLYNVSPVIEAVAARHEKAGKGLGLGLLARLATNPLWLAGLVCELGGFALEVYALTRAPLILVQPLLASGLVIVAVGAALFLRERLRPIGYLGIAALVAGVVALTVSIAGSGQQGAHLPDTDELWPAVGSATLFAGICFWAGVRDLATGHVTRAGALLGAAAGFLYTVSAIATRYLGLQISHFDLHHVAHTMVGPAPYLLAVYSVVALAITQRGLQSAAALATIPTMTVLSAVLPVPAGIFLFGEEVPSGVRAVLFVLALIAVVIGVIILGSRGAVATAFRGEASDDVSGVAAVPLDA